MKILYVVSRPLEINTSASVRNRATIDGLLELGHEVHLITSEFDKNHTNFDESLSNKRLNVKYLKLGGVQGFAKIGRKIKYLSSLKKWVYNIMSKFEIYDNLKGIVNYVKDIDIKDGDYDVIISSSDPKSSHLFVNVMFESGVIKDTPWIQIWGDPFFSDITRTNSWLNSKIKKEEEKLLKYARKVIYVSNLTLKEQKEIYPNYAMKMFYEPIPYVKKEIYPTVDMQKDSLTFLYCGDYTSEIRNILPLYEAINNSKHKLIICGGSNLKLESTDRICILPRVSFERTKQLERECDVLVHLSNSKGTQIPGKIYQYSGTNKPILFILDGEKDKIKETFNKYNRYLFCDNNKRQLGLLINSLREKIINENTSPLEEFSPKTISKNILLNKKGIAGE